MKTYLAYKDLSKALLIVFFVAFSSQAFAQSTPSSPSFLGNVNAIQIILNLNKNFPALYQLVTAFCYIFGFVLMIRGVYYLKVYGELRTMMTTQSSLKAPITYFIAGSVFIYLPTAIHVINRTFFGYNSPLAYDSSASSMNPMVLNIVSQLISFLGLIAFIRGWMILVHHAQGGGQGGASVGKALTHMIGGILSMNIIGFANILGNTFGF